MAIALVALFIVFILLITLLICVSKKDDSKFRANYESYNSKKCTCNDSHSGEECCVHNKSKVEQYTGSTGPSIKCPASYGGSTCSNNGRCDSSTGLCICNSGYSENDCSRLGYAAYSCPSNTGRAYCSNNGKCNENTGVCYCNPGWKGDDCSKKGSETYYEKVAKNVYGRAPSHMFGIMDNIKGELPDIIKKYCHTGANENFVAANIISQIIQTPPLSRPSGPDAMEILDLDVRIACGLSQNSRMQQAFNAPPRVPMRDGFPVYDARYSPY